MSTWPINQPQWHENYASVLVDATTSSINKPNTNLEEIIKKSRDFPIKFPKTTMICQNILASTGPDLLEKNIQSVYAIIHEHSLLLCVKFLLFKREHGTSIEKKLYKNTSVKDLIDRLLKKRAVAFLDSSDSHLLIDGSKGFGLWETIGKNVEKSPLILENCISYDEIKLSALLSVSSYSYFINDGRRINNGDVETNRSNIQPEGIIIGLIGTRLEKPHVMEYQEMIINQSQNQPKNGYENNQTSLHKIVADFYEEEIYTYDDKRLNDNRFVELDDGSYFDKIAYAKRLALSFDTLLIEANHRAKLETTSAYVYVVGIGLGVWKISHHQTKIFLETFINRLKFLGPHLKNVSDVNFAYISGSDCISIKNGDLLPIEDHPNKGIRILISRREPFTKLEDEGKLLVVSYPWDGNALPGNEFWLGSLNGSGDPAAAASSQIAELHNPHINKLVCGDNLMIACLSGDVLPFPEYVQKIKCE